MVYFEDDEIPENSLHIDTIHKNYGRYEIHTVNETYHKAKNKYERLSCIAIVTLLLGVVMLLTTIIILGINEDNNYYKGSHLKALYIAIGIVVSFMVLFFYYKHCTLYYF